jgi:hypothetical protein
MMGMAGLTKERLYEVTESIFAHVPGMEFTMGEMDSRLVSISGQLGGVAMNLDAMRGNIANINKYLGRMDGRLARIEKRLEIIDEPAE